MKQTERVLVSLRNAGRRGITQVDWSGASGPTPDEGPPITRLGARILELRKDGHVIQAAGRRQKCRVYVLDGEGPKSKLPEFGVPFGAELSMLEQQLVPEPIPAIYREAA